MINLRKWRSVTARAQPKKGAQKKDAQKKEAVIKEFFTCEVYRSCHKKNRNNMSIDGRTLQRRPVPWVQLPGYWLDQMGFPVGGRFSVEATDGCITLRPILPVKGITK